MISSKKGLSTVVTTLIIILLVLVAIGIVWVVIRGFIEGGAETVKYNAMCLEVDVRATSLACAGTTCNFTLTRKAGGEAIGGVKLAFKNSTGANAVKDWPGNIAPLGSNSSNNFGTDVTGANRVEVTAYFTDDAGVQRICTITNPYQI